MVNRINTILQAKNITAKQFAEEVGVQPSGVSHILSGRNNPSLDFVMKVVRRYPEININWLMFGSGEMWVGNAMPVAPVQESRSAVATNPANEQKSATPVMGNVATSAMRDGGASVVSPTPTGTVANGMSTAAAAPAQVDLHASEAKLQGGSAAQSSTQKADNLSLFDVDDPTLFTDYRPMQDLEKSGASEVAESAVVWKKADVPAATVAPAEAPVVSALNQQSPARQISAERPQPHENRVNGSAQAPVLENAIVGKQGKRIAKIVVLYDDHSFSEFYPEH